MARSQTIWRSFPPPTEPSVHSRLIRLTWCWIFSPTSRLRAWGQAFQPAAAFQAAIRLSILLKRRAGAASDRDSMARDWIEGAGTCRFLRFACTRDLPWGDHFGLHPALELTCYLCGPRRNLLRIWSCILVVWF